MSSRFRGNWASTAGGGFAGTPAGKVLKSIQVRGKATIKDVAADLGVTLSAVRLHLAQLQARGAVRAEKVYDGVGRPHHLYSITPEAHALFSQDHGELAGLLLEKLFQTQRPEELKQLLTAVAEGLAERYRDRVSGRELADRLGAWARLLDQRGATATVEKHDAGYWLTEYGCPYRNLATENRAVCEMERQVMVSLLEHDVVLSQCTLDGYPSCRFNVTEREG